MQRELTICGQMAAAAEANPMNGVELNTIKQFDGEGERVATMQCSQMIIVPNASMHQCSTFLCCNLK
jgi:hypothetical protein